MKAKTILLTACMALLLCACQLPANTEDTEADLPPESVGVEAPTPDGPTGAEPAAPLPPAPPVCEVAFTETESFPLPFKEELLVDEEEGILLSAGQALYDYDTMWALLEENYPYFDVIKEELGISSRVVKTRYRAKLVSLADDSYIAQGAFIEIITDCLNEFKMIGHLFVLSPSYREMLRSSWPNEQHQLYDNMLEIIDSQASERLYQHWVATSERQSNTQKSLLTDNHSTKEVNTVTAEYVEKIPYLRITSFSGWTDETYCIVSEFLSEIGNAEHLIIDIQGNGGGNTNAWRKGIVSQVICKSISYSSGWMGLKAGKLNLAINDTILENRNNYLVYDNISWKEAFSALPFSHVEGMDFWVEGTDTAWPAGNNCSNFSGRIWVLVDKYSYSAADQFARFCKETEFATLVGTTTGGNGMGLQPHVMSLPYSGLIIYYDPFLTFNSDGTCNGIVGTTPDVIPDAGQTALEACVAAIKRK